MTEFTAKARKLPDAAAVDAWIAEAHRRLRELEPLINGINVFPVRDRDTGTNLRVTFESARTAPAGPMDETWGGRLQAVASAASKDALGNSGTVLVIVLSTLISFNVTTRERVCAFATVTAKPRLQSQYETSSSTLTDSLLTGSLSTHVSQICS